MPSAQGRGPGKPAAAGGGNALARWASSSCSVPIVNRRRLGRGGNGAPEAGQGRSAGGGYGGSGVSTRRWRLRRGRSVARRRAQVSRGRRRRAGVLAMPVACPENPFHSRLAPLLYQAACGAGRSQRTRLDLGVGGVAAPSVGSSPASFSLVLAPFAVRSSHLPTGPPSWQPHLRFSAPRVWRRRVRNLTPPSLGFQASGQHLGSLEPGRRYSVFYLTMLFSNRTRNIDLSPVLA